MFPSRLFLSFFPPDPLSLPAGVLHPGLHDESPSGVCVCVWGGGGGGGGGTLIFSYVLRRLGLFFWVQNFVFQYFWGFQKK